MLKKYLKYKNKYLHLKNQIGGFANYIFYYFNNDLDTIYLYNVNNIDNSYETFIDTIVKCNDKVNVEYWTKSSGKINIINNEQFKKIHDGKIINIKTEEQNIKEELVPYSFDEKLQPIEQIGELRRTLSSKTTDEIKQTQKKILQSYLVDNEKSDIDIYKGNSLNNYQKVLNIGSKTIDVIPLKILFDSGNAVKTIISSKFINRCKQNNCIHEKITMPKPEFYKMIVELINQLKNYDHHQMNDYIIQRIRSMNGDVQLYIKVHTIYTLLFEINEEYKGGKKHTSEELYTSIHSHIYDDRINTYLSNLLNNVTNFYRSFITNLELKIMVGGSRSNPQILGFKKYKFSFLITGTEDNFKLKHGQIIPITVEAYELNKDNYPDILFNNTTIKTLELYNIFIGIADEKIKRINERRELDNKENEVILNKGSLDEIKAINRERGDLINYSIPCKKLDCSKKFKKMTIKNSNIYLLDKDDNKIQLKYTNEILFDTGNASECLISRSYYNKIRDYTYDHIITIPKLKLIEFLNSNKDKVNDHEERIKIDALITRMQDSTRSYPSSLKIYNTWKNTKFLNDYKAIILYLLNLRITIDSTNTEILTNIETAKLKFNLNGLDTPPIKVKLAIYDPIDPAHDSLMFNQHVCNELTNYNVFFGNIDKEDDINKKINTLSILLEVEQNIDKKLCLTQEITYLKGIKYDPVDINCVTDDGIYEYNLILEKINIKKHINKDKYSKLMSIFENIPVLTVYMREFQLLKQKFDMFNNTYIEINDSWQSYTKQFYDDYNAEFNKKITELYTELKGFIAVNINLIDIEKRPLLNIYFNISTLLI